MRVLVRVAIAAFALAVIVVALAAAFAPYLYIEYWHLEYLVAGSPPPRLSPLPVKLAKGRMFDDFFAVQNLGSNTYAIGEPRTDGQNYMYLILGQKRALLFDTGTNTRDITKVVAALTRLPVIAMVSHLHFDHLAGIGGFHDIAMIDLPATRADVHDGVFTPGRYEYGGFDMGLAEPSFHVTRWIRPDGKIDLGGRTITVLWTPGHTPTSVSLYDPAAHRLFTGDYIYTTTLYAQLPGASLSAYQATAKRLLRILPADTMLWTAHCCRAHENISAPWLDMANLRDLDRALTGIRAGKIAHTGFYPWRYPVDGEMTLATGFPWNNR